MDERDERKRSSDDASKRTWTASKPGSASCSGISVEDTCLLTMRCPVFRRRDSHLGFRMELETLAGHAKGKGTSGRPARPKVPMGQSGADRPIVAMKRGNARGAKGVGHSRRCWVNGRPEEPSFFAGRRRPSLSGTSRMRRESHVRICERLGVKFPGPTRLTTRWPDSRTALRNPGLKNGARRRDFYEDRKRAYLHLGRRLFLEAGYVEAD
jgi:hypothetical protein